MFPFFVKLRRLGWDHQINVLRVIFWYLNASRKDHAGSLIMNNVHGNIVRSGVKIRYLSEYEPRSYEPGGQFPETEIAEDPDYRFLVVSGFLNHLVAAHENANVCTFNRHGN